MKILLIQPPWYGFQKINSPRLYLGLAYIAAVLERAGHEVKILNGETFFDEFSNCSGEGVIIEEEEYTKNMQGGHYVFGRVLDFVKAYSPDLVGISFMTAVSTSAYTLARMIKEHNTNITLISGGWHPTLLPNEPLTKSVFDYVVRGEGEITMIELVKALQEKIDVGNILGISYRKNNNIIHAPGRPFIEDLDTLPLPAFHLLHDFEKQKASCTGIVTSRGCPFDCTYCASKVMWTRKVRFRSANSVMEDIMHRYHQMGIRAFSFNDDTFTLQAERVKEICNKIIANKLNIHWHCDTRGDTLNLEMLKLMKKAGCDHIYLGLETGSPKILASIKKNIKIETVAKAAALARQAGIETTVYFMTGFPDENEDDILMSIEAMKTIAPDNAIWSILTLYPGTEIWNYALERGLVNVNQNWDTSFHHYDQGNLFNSIPKETWKKLLVKIHEEQEKLHNRLTWLKIKKKIHALPAMIKVALKKPKRILPYFVRLIKRLM